MRHTATTQERVLKGQAWYANQEMICEGAFDVASTDLPQFGSDYRGFRTVLNHRQKR